MMSEDPTQRLKWLITLCAAFGIAFLFAIATSACVAPASDDDALPEVETAGSDLPEYEVAGPDEIEDDETDLLGLYDPDR